MGLLVICVRFSTRRSQYRTCGSESKKGLEYDLPYNTFSSRLDDKIERVTPPPPPVGGIAHVSYSREISSLAHTAME